MSEQKINPCPFCGSTNCEYVPEWARCSADPDQGSVWCGDCGAEGPREEMEGKAITAWNTIKVGEQLRWTKEKPGKPGWYFTYYIGNIEIIYVYLSDGELAYYLSGLPEQAYLVEEDDDTDAWAGPIPEPAPIDEKLLRIEDDEFEEVEESDV